MLDGQCGMSSEISSGFKSKKGEMQGYVERFLPAIAEAVQNRKTIDGLFEFDDLLVRVCDVLSQTGPRVFNSFKYDIAML